MHIEICGFALVQCDFAHTLCQIHIAKTHDPSSGVRRACGEPRGSYGRPTRNHGSGTPGDGAKQPSKGDSQHPYSMATASRCLRAAPQRRPQPRQGSSRKTRFRRPTLEIPTARARSVHRTAEDELSVRCRSGTAWNSCSPRVRRRPLPEGGLTSHGSERSWKPITSSVLRKRIRRSRTSALLI